MVNLTAPVGLVLNKVTVMDIFTQIVIVRRNTVQRNDQNRWENLKKNRSPRPPFKAQLRTGTD